MNTDKILAESIAKEYAPKYNSKIFALKKLDSKIADAQNRADSPAKDIGDKEIEMQNKKVVSNTKKAPDE